MCALFISPYWPQNQGHIKVMSCAVDSRLISIYGTIGVLGRPFMNKIQDILQFFLRNFEYDRLGENIALKIIANDVGSPL